MAIQVLNIAGQPFATNAIKLTWTNPSSSEYATTVVCRREDQFSLDPNDITEHEIYRGTAEEIYDYHLTKPAITSIDLLPDYDSLPELERSKWLSGNKTYYYTFFAQDKSGAYHATYNNTIAISPIKRTDIGAWLYRLLPGVYINSDANFNDSLEKYCRLLGIELDYFYSIIKYETMNLINVDRLSGDKLLNLAKTLGWDLDQSLQLQVQRRLVKNIANLYRYTGTKKGIVALVKYYTWFPAQVIITEQYAKIFKTPYFGLTADDNILYLECITPNLATLDISLIDTDLDPLYYIWDLSETGKVTSNVITIEIRPNVVITDADRDTLRTQLERVLPGYLPINSEFILKIY